MGIYCLHSVGAADDGQRFLVALLSRVPRSGGWQAARRELDRIAEATVQPMA
ncbi:MAG: hypothetical protein QOG20_1284, partial [Pseudonocardiales bacterium]|nr:hypothetical protein [Pseudonocardiales bacterium]